MADEEKKAPGTPEPETESCEHLEEEVPTEEQEQSVSDTQASELATVEVLAQEVEELRTRAAERDDFLDRLQRTKAEFINYQKRQERDRERSSEEARRAFALRVLPVLDDLDLALATARGNANASALLRGVELIHGKLLAALREEGVVPFDALGKPYDPAFHEAIAQVDRPDVLDRSIVEVVRGGYLLGERLLRAARVVVARGAKADGSASG
ncbi:MAG TPA: nucleotide exchange factor GrpE [Planctomycetota bacterium]|nr:nucleotide exchange factor GrpE [Planctomycetota bacterium]